MSVGFVDEDVRLNEALVKEKLDRTPENPSVMRILDHIAFGSANEVKNITKAVPQATSNIVTGITSQLPDVLPDVGKIDKLVESATVATYCLAAFGVMGTAYYAMRTFREVAQYRRWYKYAYLLKRMKPE